VAGKRESIQQIGPAAPWQPRARSTCLVNNAGIGGQTPLELTPETKHRAMFEANYWGPIRMIEVALPSMRERRRCIPQLAVCVLSIMKFFCAISVAADHSI
jgi:NAD(P)-dependent dehydrogenase (short-subunit alcohol dehydrogenase family)